MKIALFDSVADLYGSSRICQIILTLLRDAGHEVTPYVGLDELPPEKRYAVQHPLPLLVMGYLRASPLRYLSSLLRQTLEFRRHAKALLKGTELVYCNTFSTLPVALVARLQGKRTVVHLHETAPSAAVAAIGRRLLAASASHVLCVSHAVARSWGIEQRRNTLVVHNGILECASPPDAPRPYDIVFVGRLIEKKGIYWFLEAINRLNASLQRPVRVAVAGGPLPGKPVPDALLALSSQPCAGSGVELEYLGELTDTHRVFLQGKVACVPSLFADPFPTVVLEALRAGCSVVASNTGGASEALEGTANQLVTPGDTDGLVKALRRQLDAWDASQSPRANMQHFQLHFTLNQFRNRFLDTGIFDSRTNEIRAHRA